MRILNLVLIIFLVGHHLVHLVACYSAYYAYQTNSVDDGRKVVSDTASKQYDSRDQREPEVERKIVIAPSGSRTANNLSITKRQLMNNEIGTGLEEALFRNDGDDDRSLPAWERPNSVKYRSRGYVTKGRTVESPAQSVDSGSRSTVGTSVTSELAKLLHIKQGHYSDLYDRLDKLDRYNQLTETTSRPVESLQDAVRAAVINYYRNRTKYPKKSRSFRVSEQ